MNVRLINGTERPEEQVCKAARNDYREDGVIDYGFEEIIEAVEPSEEHLMDAIGPTEERKRTLIDQLISDGHWGPMEHPQAIVAIEGVTRVVTHQIVRHRQFSFDQQSLRYVEVEGDLTDVEEVFQIPEFRGEDFDVDREGVHEFDPDAVEHLYRKGYENAHTTYEALLAEGVPKEQARKVLPMGTKTNIVMSGNARAWMHILHVRQKGNVQGETRRCADAIFEELAEWMPYTFEQFEDYNFHGLNP